VRTNWKGERLRNGKLAEQNSNQTKNKAVTTQIRKKTVDSTQTKYY
jgi:hypothetical protein